MADTRAPAEHLSIGEVLATLQDEFPDVTISKIRFLESQGLIDPERTPSGYRKFYGDDVSRLRWILHQQKEHFLPLKVIKARLDEHGPGAPALDEEPAVDPEPEPPAPEPAPEPARARPAAKATKATPSRRKRKAITPPLPLDEGPDDDLAPDQSGASLTRAELAAAAGVSDAELAALEEYGLLAPEVHAGDRALFADDALLVAQHAAVFARCGIDARHLRMYRAFAEREASLYEQVVFPLLRQRNPEARAKAREELVELAKAGRGLRAAYLRRAIDDLLAD